MGLLSQLHDADQSRQNQARGELTRLGLSEADIRTGWKLSHPDATVRRELAANLAASPGPQFTDLLLQLSRDTDGTVRVAALEAMRKAPADARLSSRVQEMLTSDPDSVVQGTARLIAAERGAAPRTANQPGRNSNPFENYGPNSATPANRQPARERAKPAGRTLLSNAGATTGNAGQPVTAFNQHGPVDTSANRPLPSLTRQTQLDPVKPFYSLHPQQFRDGASLETGSNTAGSGVMQAGFNTGNYDDATDNGPVRFGSYWDNDEDDGSIIQASNSVGFNDGRDPTTERPFGPLDNVDPDVLNRPFTAPGMSDPSAYFDARYADEPPYLVTPIDAPNGFSGPSSVLPREQQSSNHFMPIEDRWRIGYPEWDRYGRNHPFMDDYPFVKGRWYDPYNQNVLKGDYPIIGQNTFINITAQNRFIANAFSVPIATTPFESTRKEFSEEFFGNPHVQAYQNYTQAQISLFHGATAVFKPLDWQLRVTPVFNYNHFDSNELAVVNPDVRKLTTRTRNDFALEEYFGEVKLADLSPDYDFMSARVGSQFFNSDFRGFIFSDINRGARIFGTNFGNRDQFNIVYFDMLEKETNSLLNTFDDRHQNVLIANYFRQDFMFPGFTMMANYHYVNDQPSFKFDENNFLVRPDPAGVFEPHRVEAHYFGLNTDGHIGRINFTSAFYWAVGHDSKNPIANEKQDINANMQALELSIDRDWIRFRTSYFHSSGDSDPFDDQATGFDTIMDNTNFAGGEFSYWQRNAVRLFGVNLVNNGSIVPDLRSSKPQGQPNFVNPGIHLVNGGIDFEVTPKMKIITNANYMWFETTEVLEVFTFQDNIDPEIGLDLSLGIEYRPLLTDNVVILAGFSTLIPGKGFDDLYGKAIPEVVFGGDSEIKAEALYSNFIEVILQY